MCMRVYIGLYGYLYIAVCGYVRGVCVCLGVCLGVSGQVHAYLLTCLRKQIPMWGKDAKKRQLIQQLQQVYTQVATEHALPLGDFPPLPLMQVLPLLSAPLPHLPHFATSLSASHSSLPLPLLPPNLNTLAPLVSFLSSSLRLLSSSRATRSHAERTKELHEQCAVLCAGYRKRKRSFSKLSTCLRGRAGGRDCDPTCRCMYTHIAACLSISLCLPFVYGPERPEGRCVGRDSVSWMPRLFCSPLAPHRVLLFLPSE